MPNKIFQDIPWSEWGSVNPEKLNQADVDKGEEFRQAKAVPARWVLGQLGLANFAIGEAKISPDCASIQGGIEDHKNQLKSYLKQQVRDKLGIQLQDVDNPREVY